MPKRSKHHLVEAALATEAGAVVVGDYRYLLWRADRQLSLAKTPGVALWVMLNPSTADATKDDPTIRRCRAFSRRLSYERLAVVNLFGLRTPHPDQLATVDDPVGASNDEYIAQAASMATTVITAWGRMRRYHDVEGKRPPVDVRERAKAVFEVLAKDGKSPWCLGTNRDGSPRHPLYLKGDVELVPWNPEKL